MCRCQNGRRPDSPTARPHEPPPKNKEAEQHRQNGISRSCTARAWGVGRLALRRGLATGASKGGQGEWPPGDFRSKWRGGHHVALGPCVAHHIAVGAAHVPSTQAPLPNPSVGLPDIPPRCLARSPVRARSRARAAPHFSHSARLFAPRAWPGGVFARSRRSARAAPLLIRTALVVRRGRAPKRHGALSPHTAPHSSAD